MDEKNLQRQATTTASYVIYATVALYALAFMSQQPTKLFWVKAVTEKSEDAAHSYATLLSFFAVLQLFGGLFCGALVDRLGSKFVLLLSLFSSMLLYALTANANSMLGLFIAGVPSIFQHAVLAARAYLTSTTDAAQHATVLSRIGIAYGVGMVIGPLVGGHIAAYSLFAAAACAALLSLFTAVLVWVSLPDIKVNPPSSTNSSSSNSSSSSSNVDVLKKQPISYVALVQIPGILSALTLKCLFFLSSQLFQSTFTLLAVDRFGMDASGLGNVLSIGGLFSAVANLLLPFLTAVPQSTVLFSASLACALSIFALGLIPSSFTLGLYLLCIPQTMLAVIFSTIQSTTMTSMTPPTLHGSLNAADMSLRSTCSIFSPFLAQSLLKYGGNFAGTSLPAALMTLVAFLSLAGGAGAEVIKKQV